MYTTLINPGIFLENLKQNEQIIENLRRIGLENPENITDDVIRRNIVCFKIYYNDLRFMSITQAPTKNIFDFLADIGGTLGMNFILNFAIN